MSSFDRFLPENCVKPDYVSFYNEKEGCVILYYIDRSDPNNIRLISPDGSVFVDWKMEEE